MNRNNSDYTRVQLRAFLSFLAVGGAVVLALGLIAAARALGLGRSPGTGPGDRQPGLPAGLGDDPVQRDRRAE